MAKIHLLPQDLINQIAAWEVVERPLSVVKELVENSLDAGGKNIIVEIQNWWIDAISVQDDGEGIAQDDLQIILQKHATSKISNLKDLYEVRSFWFRGEALSAISSVSKFEIYTRHKDDKIWNHLQFTTQDGLSIQSFAFDKGTKVVVSNLFFNTPARLNYLKQPSTEYAKISQYLQSFALIHPEIGIEFFHNDKKIFKYQVWETMEVRMYAILWEDFSKHTISVNFWDTNFWVSGYITNTQTHFANKSRQYLYVNYRPISSPLIYKAISDAYHRFIPPKMFPGYILHIQIDPTQIDANVHPQKKEIRFAQESSIFRLVYSSLHELLQKDASYLPQISPYIETPSASIPTLKYYTGSGEKIKSYSPYKNTTSNPAQSQIKASLDFTKEFLSPSGKRTPSSSPSQDLKTTHLGKILGQLAYSYILVDTGKEVIFFDQHALDERILYEKLKDTSHIFAVQQLLVPEVIKLTTDELDVYTQYQDIFRKKWFDAEILPHETLSVGTIPDFIKKNNTTSVILWILQDLAQGNTQTSTRFDDIQDAIFASIACRSAVKFWDPLNIFEMHHLLSQIWFGYSATCPHGRPVSLVMSLEDLKKNFLR